MKGYYSKTIFIQITPEHSQCKRFHVCFRHSAKSSLPL